MSRRLELIVASVMAVTLVTFSIRQRRRRKTIPPTQREKYSATRPATGIKSIGSNQLAKGDKQKAAKKSRFYAQSDAKGLLPMNLRFVDTFLRWECGKHLLGLGLFPDAKEISESVACLQTILEQSTTFQSSHSETLAVCIGDGRTPRTAALLAMRTRWDCISIDPALDGLEQDNGTAFATRVERVAARANKRGHAAAKPLPVPKELRHSNLLCQETTDSARSQRARLKDGLKAIDRLRVLACRAEEAAVWVGSDVARIVIMLPHAHVTPDEALGCLRFDSSSSDSPPIISIVQLPCCAYVWHDHALGAPPDSEMLDGRVCASARTVRVWRDVAPRFNFGASALGLGARTARRHGGSSEKS